MTQASPTTEVTQWQHKLLTKTGITRKACDWPFISDFISMQI